MKKLLPIAAILTLVAPFAYIILRELGFRSKLNDIGQTIAVYIGWSMIVTGIFAMIFSAALTEGKERIYQGAFCALIGIAISTFSLPAFIAAIALVAWMDFRGRSLK